MSKNMEFSEENLKKIAKTKVNYRRAVNVHVGMYFMVNLMLIIINLLTSYSYYWFLYPLFGWLIGVILHVVAYSLYAKGVRMAKRLLVLHFFAWFSVNLLLFIIDFEIVDMFYFHSINWAYIPAVSWFTGFLIHLFLYMIFVSSTLAEDGTKLSKKEIAIEKEMQKIRGTPSNGEIRVKCPNCGNAFEHEDTNFCQYCGTKI